MTRRHLAVAACLGTLAAGAGATEAQARTVGDGTPSSCTSAKVVAAVRAGGTIRFSCGSAPVTIRMRATAKVRNRVSRVVLDGGGKVTLSGMGQRRILYMNTCDRSLVWTTPHCQDQSSPQLTIRGMTFRNGNSTGERVPEDPGGGGAIFARGGRLAIEDSTFVGNRCDRTGPDLGGGAVRALSQYRDLPLRVVRSTFRDNVCANGGALSSIDVSWDVVSSTFTGNRAIGRGANPRRAGTPGGGSGGAIYNDGDRYRLSVTGSRIIGNHAREGGGAIFFVSNDRTGSLAITDSTLQRNPSEGFETRGLPGIFFLGASRQVVRSTLE
jgi:hypothetical protein